MSALLSPCAHIGALAVNSTSRLFGDYEVYQNISFGAYGQRLDVYAPRLVVEPAPVVVFFYGGGWNMGSKEMFAFVGDALTSLGYIAVIPDYRKYPEVTFPAFMEDGAQAISWVAEHITEYHGNPRGLNIMGHSCGAHLGALLVSDERYLLKADVMLQQIRAFAGLAGPYHFVPEAELYQKVFGAPANYPNMHVDNFIDGREPPMLLLAGENDETVGISNLETLQSAIEQHSGWVQSKIYPGLGHIDMITPLTRPLRHAAPLLEDIDHFFRVSAAR